MKRPSPAAVIACVALFFSLGGASLAATAASGPATYDVYARAPLASSASETVVSASCHPNDHLVMGGFQSAHGIVTSSYPLGREWIVRAHRDPAYQAPQNMSGATVAPRSQPPTVGLTVECQSG